MKDKIENLIKDALVKLGAPDAEFSVEHPEDLKNGDYSTNVAMVCWKKFETNELKPSRVQVADMIGGVIKKNLPNEREKIEVAGGFINFYLNNIFFEDSIKEILKSSDNFGHGKALAGQKAIIEYTDPNPFKEFHIGHLMANTIGEALSRLVEWNGAETRRACYQGDIGLHVAKAVWAILKNNIKPDDITADVLGRMYAVGNLAYESDEQTKGEIEDVNRKIYNLTDRQINEVYNQGKKLSLEYFEKIYKKLGTKFDFYFLESTSGNFGEEIVREATEKGIFEKSDGATVFRGEKYGLHTRVFVNSQGLPTYEAKDLGLMKIKYDLYPYDRSVVVTGNEQSDYFKVVLRAAAIIFPDLYKKTTHISHGMLRLPSGKMSSRTGEVVAAENLLAEISARVKKKMAESGRVVFTEELADQISVGALKYSILKQAIGRDIIFDFEKSISFEGDSGPYLQYSHARAQSILKKAIAEKLVSAEHGYSPAGEFLVLAPSRSQGPAETSFSAFGVLERLIYRFSEIVEQAWRELAPHHVASYLIELCHAFNTFYVAEKIVDANDPASPYKIALTAAFTQVLRNGLTVLGISAPEEM